MVLALVCLWIGFALGFIVAAVLRGGSRGEEERAVVAATPTTFAVSHVPSKKGKAAARNTAAHVETVE